MNIHIRTATPDDVDGLARLATQLGYPSQAGQIARRLQSLPRRGTCVFVAETEGTIVGWLQVSLHATLLLDDNAEIIGFIVEEKKRGRGIGHALLQAAEAWAMERGCSTLFVRVNIVRQRAHEFYLHCGFQHIKTSLVLSKPLVRQT